MQNDSTLIELNDRIAVLKTRVAGVVGEIGEISVELNFEIDNTKPNTIARLRIRMKHYSYKNFGSAVDAEGLEWYEVQAELLRKLSRDVQLKRLEAPKKPTPSDDEIPF